MRLGLAVPQFGADAGPDALQEVARRAEDLGYDSLWVAERLLYPVNPKAPYPATADGSLPLAYRRSLDPLAVLAYLAAATSRVRIGSFINLTFHNPVLLARELVTIDVLSNGRLDIGFGVGWSPDEFEAIGVPMRDRGRRAEETLQVIEAIWRDNPVQFEGRYFRVPESFFDLKPVQKPRPPIYMAAYAPATMDRAARLADGWIPAGVPLGAMEQMFAGIKQGAAEAGRDPSKLKLIVTANIEFHPAPLGDERPIFVGSVEQIEEDISATRRLGAEEIIFNAIFSPDVGSTDDLLSRMEHLRTMARRSE
ncbi:MAG TPA: TIGR03619 family F420-dependent LLM class oxidoreductase [Rubrobacteraceae bacterium]|jgi:probable F420-dependent oxidoreductase|nr:TIGR03619 family F420-dependent LLM class oxidoreductase [Rubrobacteraceae bacterium]